MQQRIDSLAQQVEHNTFNVGVLGSSPRRITKESESYTKVTLFFLYLNCAGLPTQAEAQFENLGELKLPKPFH